MLGDLPSIVPRRNYDIRTQCLKGTCSSSELPGQWHAFVLDAVRPCRGCSSMLLRQRPMEGRLRVPLVDRIHCSGFPDRADDGVRTRGFLLGKQACCRCTTSAWPGFPNGSDHIPSDRRSACFPAPGNQGLVARGGIRTHDLQVMSLAGYRTALPRMAALSRGRRTAGACSGRPARGRSRAAARRGPRMRADRRRQARHGGIEPPWTVLETVGLPLS